MSMTLSRRETLLSALTAVCGVSASVASPLGTVLAEPVSGPVRPADWAIPYGAALRDGPLADEPAYREAIVGHCRQVVGEGGLKWFDLRPSRERFVFDLPDKQMAFATEHGLEMRGHTLVWYGAMPDWTRSIATAAEAERELVGHIEQVMGRYRGRIKSWDVINEPIPDDPASRSELRPSVWQQRLGEGHLALALRTAARTDPEARLVINEYDIEHVGDRYRRKREAFLRLIRDLKLRNAPLHGIGLQGHLRGDLPIDRDGLSAFVSELRGMGLEVVVTELDVVDDRLPGPPDLRDMLVAARVFEFLQAIHAAARPSAVLTWGITDKYSWVPIYFKRRDGLPNRPLPLDDAYRPKPLMRVIEHFGRGPR
jgi:endo-1,4-beta-xylanase